MGREENVLVFKDTEKLCKTNEKLREAIRKSTENQKIILEQDVIEEVSLDRYEEKAKIVVSAKRTYEAAKAYPGKKVMVHNFASATNPGGGVVRGSSAQEECLCRCSSLYFNLNVQDMWDGFYTPHRQLQNPLHNDDIIFTPDVTVFKTDTSKSVMLEEKDWYKVDVITCAAPNLRKNPQNAYNSKEKNQIVKIKDKELLMLHEKRLKRILDTALVYGDEVIVLGAFGCGAFCNNPEVVALAARNVIKQYLHAFQTIEFAVYCSSKDDRNYKTFQRLLKMYSAD